MPVECRRPEICGVPGQRLARTGPGARPPLAPEARPVPNTASRAAALLLRAIHRAAAALVEAAVVGVLLTLAAVAAVVAAEVRITKTQRHEL